MNTENSGLIFSTDERDKNFAFSKITKTRPPYKQKEWWADGWWGNQGYTPHCCAYSWVHVLEDGPVIQDSIKNREIPIINPEKFYRNCKLIDNLPPNTNGTTIRAGAQVAKNLGLISEYRWADNLDELIDALLIYGPVVAGTKWYSEMNASSNGIMKPTGRLIGGHAYVMNGVDVSKEQIRVKNSYGREWGKNGYGFLSFDSVKKLFKEGGVICVPFENKASIMPIL